jgi:hypothetical protein
MTTPFWINSPTILFDKNHINQLFPNKKMIAEEKLNAITRLILLLTLLGYLITRKIKFVITGLITIAALIILYKVQQQQQSRAPTPLKKTMTEAFTNPEIYKRLRNQFTNPTAANPAMNILMTEYSDNPERNQASAAFMPIVEKEINAKTQEYIIQNQSRENENKNDLKDKLFKDLGDSFEFDQSMRAWYANPSTTIPNDQESFAEYCYGDMISCKEGNEFACVRNAPPQWNNN